MSVTVDEQPLAAEQMGMRTVGQVLAHLRKANRLVVQVLIDGQAPDLNHLGAIRQSPLGGHTLYIETTEPRRMAGEVLDEVESQLGEADRLRQEAAECLQQNQSVRAMERLSGCFSTWQHAQEAILKTARLLEIDLNHIRIGDVSLSALLAEFTGQLRQIKEALESRDFVTLSDILCYEMAQTRALWGDALASLRAQIDD